MNKVIGHFRTVTRHRHVVIAHCFRAGIPWQGLLHDLSKYSPVEFIPGVRYYTGVRSPNEGEREAHGSSLAWMHHKGRNKHHFEYWIDYSIATRKMEPVKMPFKYVVEMFCDRVAASKIYMGERYSCECPLRYFERGINSHMIHPETGAFLTTLLTMLCEEGEDATFRYLRRRVRENPTY